MPTYSVKTSFSSEVRSAFVFPLLTSASYHSVDLEYVMCVNWQQSIPAYKAAWEQG